jgi:light-regulated signal transduction histidine kinase (bacteriophytochrome)
MQPLISRIDDTATLQDLGRASFQIVHDLKNQLNGLKLYATFLRRRLEKSERPDDEQETVAKLINGLDRAANDLSTIVQYGRQIELKKQSGLELQKVMRSICSAVGTGQELVFSDSNSSFVQGEFDQTKLTDALKWISIVAAKYPQSEVGTISVSLKQNGENRVTVEWAGLAGLDHDPFHSFVGSDEIRMSLGAKIIEAHGGSAVHAGNSFVVSLPLSSESAIPE